MKSYHGTNVDGENNVDEALARSNLDWTVETAPVQIAYPDGSTRRLPDTVATYREDTKQHLGVVTSKYHVFQNDQCFDWLQQLCDDGALRLSHAAEYRGGRKIAMTCELPTKTIVGGDDVVQRYLLAVNNHDGGGSVRLFPSTIRAVCENTLRLLERKANRSETMLKMVHRETSLADRVSKGRDFLQSITLQHNQFQTLARQMNSQNVTDIQVAAYFKTLASMKASSERSADRAVDQLQDIYANDKNAGGYGHNVWTMYNAVSEWSDHHGRKRSGESRLQSNLFGQGDSFKRSAFELAWTFVAA
jgi:phage/plasmid-like protein (TIGR03299 family)